MGLCCVCSRPTDASPRTVMVDGSIYCSPECYQARVHGAELHAIRSRNAGIWAAVIGYAILFAILYGACRIATG